MPRERQNTPMAIPLIPLLTTIGEPDIPGSNNPWAALTNSRLPSPPSLLRRTMHGDQTPSSVNIQADICHLATNRLFGAARPCSSIPGSSTTSSPPDLGQRRNHYASL